jgi:hypothetical protein
VDHLVHWRSFYGVRHDLEAAPTVSQQVRFLFGGEAPKDLPLDY